LRRRNRLAGTTSGVGECTSHRGAFASPSRKPLKRQFTAALTAILIVLFSATGVALAAEDTPVSGSSYVVQSGDTIRGIGLRLGINPEDIVQLNRLANPDRISIGQTLLLPTSLSSAEQSNAELTRDVRATPSSRGGAIRMAWPARGPITTIFGEIGPYWANGRHPGLDIGASLGTPVRAAEAGRVIEVARSGYNGGYGHYVKIDHGSGVHTLYAHLSTVRVDEGEWVGTGDLLGAIGLTGLTTGPHLHFEVRVNGVRVDPAGFLP
jgi:murein DD-endopeptidase MepM/ murein hydrolase activator NlpD